MSTAEMPPQQEAGTRAAAVGFVLPPFFCVLGYEFLDPDLSPTSLCFRSIAVIQNCFASNLARRPPSQDEARQEAHDCTSIFLPIACRNNNMARRARPTGLCLRWAHRAGRARCNGRSRRRAMPLTSPSLSGDIAGGGVRHQDPVSSYGRGIEKET
jgi:hypothetical protein